LQSGSGWIKHGCFQKKEQSMQTPPPIGQVSSPRTAGLAIASLVLGILSVSCLSILAGIPALILGIVALSKIGKSAGTLVGQGLAIAGLVLGGVSFLLLPITAALVLPAFSNARGAAYQAACLNNVRQCTLACQMYAQEHEATLPNSLDDVKKFMGNEAAAQQALHCHQEKGTAVSYELVTPGKKLADLGQPAETIIIREINAPHRGKRAVGFADGHVEMRADK
jgi:prepilin-type processing-associated H-X9-DG protein